MSKQIEITLEQAKELLVTTPSLKDVIYSNFPELKPNVVPDSFKDLGEIRGYYMGAEGSIYYASKLKSRAESNKNVFKTEKQAQSALAMAQLSQLMAATGDCNVNWSGERLCKYCIIPLIRSNGVMELSIVACISYKQFLAFNTKKIAEEFLNKHSDLIKQYYNY